MGWGGGRRGRQRPTRCWPCPAPRTRRSMEKPPPSERGERRGATRGGQCPPRGRAPARVRCVFKARRPRFLGGLVFKAHRLVYHSALGLRVIKKKKKGGGGSPQRRARRWQQPAPPRRFPRQARLRLSFDQTGQRGGRRACARGGGGRGAGRWPARSTPLPRCRSKIFIELMTSDRKSTKGRRRE